GVEKATLEALWSDWQKLKKVSKREKWTDRTPVAPDFFGPMWPDGLPEKWPALAATSVVKARKRSRRRPSVEELGLPADLLAFLQAERQLEFDPRQTMIGPVKLKPLAHLQFDTLTVTTEGTHLERKDPHRGEEGYYLLRVVDLIGECDAYGPYGLFAWFCDYKAFGTWDADHHIAIVFPKVSWSKIAADPAKYLDAQWDLNRKVGKYLEPWRHCAFKEGY